MIDKKFSGYSNNAIHTNAGIVLLENSASTNSFKFGGCIDGN